MAEPPKPPIKQSGSSSQSGGAGTTGAKLTLKPKNPVATAGMARKQARPSTVQKVSIPNASMVYGLGGTALFVLALLFLVRGEYWTALIVMFAAGCLLAYAVYFLRWGNSTQNKM